MPGPTDEVRATLGHPAPRGPTLSSSLNGPIRRLGPGARCSFSILFIDAQARARELVCAAETRRARIQRAAGSLSSLLDSEVRHGNHWQGHAGGQLSHGSQSRSQTPSRNESASETRTGRLPAVKFELASRPGPGPPALRLNPDHDSPICSHVNDRSQSTRYSCA